ncbi:MAG: RimK family alpha-L-glutamate ligase [Candidatus Bathyarchaeota archaeon]|nr:MAG: RimK family alpha-L-glutamate ligase [Candidatus Bathyarchaeota archaeon]
MKMGIFTKNENAWSTIQLRNALEKQNITSVCLSFPKIVARIKHKPEASIDEVDIIKTLSALIVRPIGHGSLEEIIFRMDFLHHLKRLGMLIVNPPLSIERSVDKYHTLALLEEHGLPVPGTAITENPHEALKCFKELGEDVVVKPLFGSRGVGATRVSDPEIATRVFKAIAFCHSVIYLQKFIPHGNTDIRALVLDDHVVASMRRVADNWKTNVSLGAKPVALKLDKETENLAVEAAKVIGCGIAGVDILEGPKGLLIAELNSQPGWRGLQSVTAINIADEIIQYVLSALKV